jgi:hypothetical protein
LDLGHAVNIVVNWSGVRNGKSRSSIERATEEIKRFAPKQRAIVSSAAVIRPGLLGNWWKADFKTLISF